MVVEDTGAGRETEERHQPFDLAARANALRGEAGYAANGRSGSMLVKTDEVRVMLQAIRAGAHLAEHHAPGPITVHVVEGEIEFSVDGKVHALRAGQMLFVPARVPHALSAVRDSAFLVTLVPPAEREVEYRSMQ